MPDRGVLYFAKGEKFLEEVEISAARIKEVMPDFPIAVVTDIQTDSDHIDTVLLDEIEFTKADKPRSLLRSPYEQTLFLDSDIWMYKNIDEVFDILDQYELGLVKDPLEPHVHDIGRSHPIVGVPEAFPEFNTGFLLFKNTANMTALFEDWKSRCNSDDNRDQRAFRPALYHSNVHFTSLPPRYNCMYRAENALNGEVKVFHGQLVEARSSGHGYHGIELDEAIEKINQHYSSRVSYRYKDTVIVNPPFPAFTHLQYTLQEEGIVPAIRGVLKYIRRQLASDDRLEIDGRR